MRGWRTAAGLLGAALALWLTAEAAQAQTSVTLVSNTGQSLDGGNAFNIPRAQPFTTGSNASGYKLTSVTFTANGNLTVLTGLTVRIESSGTDNKPGGSLGALTLSGGFGGVTGTTTGIDLDANTTYFVVLRGSNDAINTYLRTNSNSEDTGAAAGWSIGDGSLWDDDTTVDWDQTSTTSLQIAIHGYAKAAPPTVSGASYSPAHITVNFNGTFTGCADLIAWSFRVDGGTQEWPLAVRCEGQSVKIILDGVSDVPRVEAARRVTVSYHRGLARSAARSTPFCNPQRGCRPASSELKGTNGVDVASFTDFPVSGLKPRLVPPPAVNGNKVTLTFDEPLDPGLAAAARGLPRHRERRAALRRRGRHRRGRQDGDADPGLGGGRRRDRPGALHQPGQHQDIQPHAEGRQPPHGGFLRTPDGRQPAGHLVGHADGGGGDGGGAHLSRML